MKKFTKSIKVPEHFKIKTDTGYKKCNYIHETIEYDVWKFSTDYFDLKCADNHIVFDESYNEVFIKDLKNNQLIKTINGNENVNEAISCGYKERMFDLEINDNNHRYYTNNILSHNTSLAKILADNYPTLYLNISDESSVDVIRTKITDWCSTVSVLDDKNTSKVVILDECLDENEEVRIGTIDSWKPVRLKDLEKNIVYNCVSMNITTKKLENDICIIVSDKNAELYEVELEDGRKILVTENHPFMISDANGNAVEKSISDGLGLTDNVICF